MEDILRQSQGGYMAFHEEPEPRPQYASPLMAFEGKTLFALVLQFIAGGVSIYYAIPSVILAMSIIGYYYITMTGWLYIIAWAGLSLILWPQMYFAYRLYKKAPGAVQMALLTDVVACIFYAIDVVVSATEGILLLYPDVMIFLGINVVAVILLMMPDVKEAFAPEGMSQSYGTEYGSSQSW
jgi:hypothetical protein